MLNLYPTHTDQPPNYTINGLTYQAGAIQEVVFNNFQASIASQTLFLTPPSVGVFQIPDGASTQGALTITGNLTCNAAVNIAGALTCESLTVTQGLPGGGGGGISQTFEQTTAPTSWADQIGTWQVSVQDPFFVEHIWGVKSFCFVRPDL